MEERWEFVYYTTRYGKELSLLVSDNGRIRIPTRIQNRRNGSYALIREREAKYSKIHNGYIRGAGLLVHRLVAEAFVEKPKDWNEKWDVNHKDCDKENNHWSNLEWVTHQQNLVHYLKHTSAIGVRTHPVEVWNKDGEWVGVYPSKTSAGKALDVSKQAITMMLNHNYKQAKGYIFKKITKEEYYEKKRIPNGRVTENKSGKQTKVR